MDSKIKEERNCKIQNIIFPWGGRKGLGSGLQSLGDCGELKLQTLHTTKNGSVHEIVWHKLDPC